MPVTGLTQNCPTKEDSMELHSVLSQIRDAYKSERPMAFYVAAGISKDCPTHLPLGRGLRDAVVSGFFEIEKNRDLTILREALEKRSLEEVCGVVQYELGDKRRLISLMSVALDSADIIPNQIHRILARALYDGHLVVTTNYDGLIEKAYKIIYRRKFPSTRICYDDESFKNFLKQFLSIPFGRVSGTPGWLLKLHGTFHLDSKDVGESVMTTLDRVGKGLPPSAQRGLAHVLQNCPIVVMGYGCMDIDIVYPVLVETASSEPAWWVRHKQAEQVRAYDEVKQLLEEEDRKGIQANVQTLNVCRVLTNRGENNGGKVWLIDTLTSQMVLMLMAQIGGEYGARMRSCEGDEDRWRNVLEQLAASVSAFERLAILAKLAQICGPYKSGSLDIYDLSDKLFKGALEQTPDLAKKARIHREMGWNMYRRAPETNAEQAIRLYQEADGFLPQAPTQFSVERIAMHGARALALRRARRIIDALGAAENAWGLLPAPLQSRALSSEPEDVRAMLQSMRLPEGEWGRLGSVLRRVAGVYDQCVSGPVTLATAIRCEYLWKMEERERRLLERARRLLEFDRCLQHLLGERREKIQSENQLGLVCSKVKDGETAQKVHKESLRVAEQFGWRYEQAQAFRNSALAHEVAKDLDQSISSLVNAMTLFEQLQRTGDLNSALWHLGRIRIKIGDANGIKDIDKHLSTAAGWHGKANDCVLLGIGYYDLLNNDAVGRQHFASMLRQYPEMDEELKNQAYGVDNALANAIAAIERLGRDTSSEAAHLRAEFGLFRKRLESLRSKTIQSLPFVA
jgi:tetratricopeptide (TPR) repeat protein